MEPPRYKQLQDPDMEAGSRPAAAAGAAAAAAAGVDRRMQHFSIFYRDAEVTLGTFAVHFGRRFGTKLGRVLVQKRRVSGRGMAGGPFGLVFLWLRR